MMRDIHRHIHFDFHTMPGITDFNKDWDPAKFAQMMADAHVDYINFAAGCNLGFSYYKTKLGIEYPGMKGDMLGDVIRECHARGIGVTAYINIGLMHELAHRHPEWLRVNKEGTTTLSQERVQDNFFRMMCYNSRGYHEHLLGVIKEICEYDIDGLFCDCVKFFPCHCKDCTDDMIKLGIDIEDEVAVENFSKDVLFKVGQEIKEIVGPDRYLFFNAMPYDKWKNIDTHIELECLPSFGGWGYEFFWTAAASARTHQKKGIYMTGRFQHEWGDFGGYKGKASIENDLYDGLCNNMIPSVGDHMHPAGLPEEGIYKEIGEIYERFMKYEPYTEGAEYVADIGVLTSEAKVGRTPLYQGLARMLAELKQSFNVVHTDCDFEPYQLLIIPDKLRLSEKVTKKLEKYIANGGKILISGFGGLKEDDSDFALSAINASFEGADTSNSSYFDYVKVPEGSLSMTYETYEEGILMKAKNEKDVRAWHVKPYFDKHWDGRHGYFYTPPKERTGYTAAMCDGTIAYICFRVFEAYHNSAYIEHKRLVAQLLEELLPNPMIKVVKGIPSTARVTTTRTNEHTLLHVKVTFPEPRGKMNIIEEHVVLPAGAEIAVRGEYEGAYLLPSEKPMATRIENGYTIVTLDSITGYDMFMLK